MFNKTKKNNIKMNFLYNMLQQLSMMFVPLITSPYVSRVLGVKNIGVQSWLNSILTYFMLFSILGINNYGSRTIAIVNNEKEKIEKNFINIYFIQFFMSLLMTVLYLLYIFFFIASEYKLIGIIQTLYLFSNMFDISWIFYGLEEFKIIAVRNLNVKLFSIIFIFVFIKNENDLWKYVLILALSNFLAQIYSWIILLKKIKLVKIEMREIKNHLKPIIILFIPVLSVSIFTVMDKYMIGKLSNIYENAYYENAIKIISIPKALITVLGSVMLPRTTNLIATGKEEESKKLIVLTMFYTSILSGAFVFGLMGIADVFSIIFWGRDFYNSGKLILYLAPSVTISVFGNIVRTQYLIPVAKDREYTYSLIFGAIVNFLINMLLIPIYGAFGAVIGTVLAELVITGFQFFYTKNYINLTIYFKDIVIFQILGLLMYLSLSYIKKYMSISITNLLILIILGSFIYSISVGIYILKSKNSILIEIKNMIPIFREKR